MTQARRTSVTAFLAAFLIAVIALIAVHPSLPLTMRPHLQKALERVAFVPQLNRSLLPSLSTLSIRPTIFFPKTSINTPPTAPNSTRNFTTTTPKMSNMSFLDAVANRRSNYVLTDKIPISDDRVVELATAAIKNVPSSFNSQSARMVVLLNDEHKKFWEITKEVLKPQVPEDKFGATEKKLDGFKAGHGTVRLLPLSPPLLLSPPPASHLPMRPRSSNPN